SRAADRGGATPARARGGARGEPGPPHRRARPGARGPRQSLFLPRFWPRTALRPPLLLPPRLLPPRLFWARPTAGWSSNAPRVRPATQAAGRRRCHVLMSAPHRSRKSYGRPEESGSAARKVRRLFPPPRPPPLTPLTTIYT